MQIIFFGSDQYSSLVLMSLTQQENLLVSAVVTTRPKPVGRDHVLTPNPVEKYAVKQNIKVVYYPDNLDEMSKFISTLPITSDTHGLSASFPRIMPSSLIGAFSGRLYNLHPSLLPQFRNVAPVPYAIALGEPATGITLFRIGDGIDNGEILTQTQEPIVKTDSTPILLTRLFKKGTELFTSWLTNSTHPTHVSQAHDKGGLIFTHKLTREFGYVEWPVILKLIVNHPIFETETQNPLVKLRLTHFPDRNNNILSDLIRALDGYEKVWTIAKTKKGPLEISFKLENGSSSTFAILIAGKPRPLAWDDFVASYL